MLTLSNIACSRGDTPLFANVNLSLAQGEALYLAGANGAGKTSLLRLICGLAVPEGGRVLWHGEPIRQLREEYSRNLLFLGHAAALKDELSAIENLVVSAMISGRSVSLEQAERALQFFGLAGRESLPSRVLSAGQRRRVNLARLVLPNPPKLWVLDEPFTALDARAVEKLIDILAGHLASTGMLIFTSHLPVDIPGCSMRRFSIDSQQLLPC